MGRKKGRLTGPPEVSFDTRGHAETVTITFRFSGEKSRDAAIREAAQMGLPQKAISEAFGICQPRVSRILRGHGKGIKRRLRRKR